jgi:protein phosphatase 1G
VSAFVERHFIEELERNKNFKSKNYESALKETFLRMD